MDRSTLVAKICEDGNAGNILASGMCHSSSISETASNTAFENDGWVGEVDKSLTQISLSRSTAELVVALLKDSSKRQYSVCIRKFQDFSNYKNINEVSEIRSLDFLI